MTCKNKRAVRIDGKLNPTALREADREVPSCSNYSERKRWMDAYIRAGGQWECADPSGTTPRKIEEKCLGDLYVKVTSDDGISAIADALVAIPTLGQQLTSLGDEASWIGVGRDGGRDVMGDRRDGGLMGDVMTEMEKYC